MSILDPKIMSKAVRGLAAQFEALALTTNACAAQMSATSKQGFSSIDFKRAKAIVERQAMQFSPLLQFTALKSPQPITPNFPQIAPHEVETLLGLTLIPNPMLTITITDWSKCRSPSRAHRRLARGFKQRCETKTIADPAIYLFQGKATMHPETMTRLKLAVQNYFGPASPSGAL